MVKTIESITNRTSPDPQRERVIDGDRRCKPDEPRTGQSVVCPYRGQGNSSTTGYSAHPECRLARGDSSFEVLVRRKPTLNRA